MSETAFQASSRTLRSPVATKPLLTHPYKQDRYISVDKLVKTAQQAGNNLPSVYDKRPPKLTSCRRSRPAAAMGEPPWASAPGMAMPGLGTALPGTSSAETLPSVPPVSTAGPAPPTDSCPAVLSAVGTAATPPAYTASWFLLSPAMANVVSRCSRRGRRAGNGCL